MKIAVVGGDARMLTAARLFSENGFETVTAALSEGSAETKNVLRGAAAAVLPLPCEKDGILNSPMSNKKINIADIFAAAEGGTLFIGGKLPQKGQNFADYAERESFLIRNAAITAEAAVGLALQSTSSSLFGAKILIIGYGRIAVQLLRLLLPFGALVTVAARRAESRVLAELSGASAIDTSELKKALPSASIIFNTVPNPLLNEKDLALIKSGVPIIDLASGTGCCDQADAKKANANLIRALALPGKHAPVSAGEAVFEVALEILRERGMLK